MAIGKSQNGRISKTSWRRWQITLNCIINFANIVFKVVINMKNQIWRDYWIKISKIKNGPFSGPIYHQIHLDRVKKAYTLMTSMEKQKKCTSQIFDFWNFITHFLKWSEGHFLKFQNMWINEKNQKSLKMFCKNPSLLKMIFIFLAA